MAKKDDVNFDEVSLDDIDFGDDFDFSTDGEIKFDADDRSPIGAFTSSVKDGLKNRIMDRGMLRRLVSFALPKGYSQAFNAYDSLSNGVADIYKANAAELSPYMQKTNQYMKQSNPLFKRMLPKRVREALEASEHGSNDWGSQQDDQLGASIAGIDQLLGMQAAKQLEDNIKGATKDIRDRKQFQSELGVQLESGKSLGRLVEFQNTVTVNYYRKSLELKYRHLDVSMRTHHAQEAFFADATDLLKAVGHNTALPDFVKMRSTEILKEQLRHRLANNVINSASNFANKHLGTIGKNISDSIGGFLGMANAAGSMAGPGMSRSAMAGDAAGGLVAEGLGDMLEFGVKEALTRMGLGKEAGAIKSGGRFLQDKLSGWSQRLNDYARSETKREGLLGQGEDWLKRLFDSYTITDKINGGGVYGLDEAAKFDNLFHKTVVEIIPGQLSSMEKWLRTIATGQEQEEHAYSHYSGGFVTRSTLNKQHVDIGLKAGAGDAVRKQLDFQLKTMKAEGLSPKARKALRARLMTDMSSNRDFNPKEYIKPTSWQNLDPEVAEELVEFFAENYGIGIDGEYDATDEEAAELRTKARAEYLDLAPRITDYTGRMAGLSEVIGRRAWRELGLAEYDGRSGDNILPMKVYDMIANEGGDEFVPEDREDEKAPSFDFSRQGIKDGINARAEIARRKLKEKEEKQKRDKELAAAAGRSTRVDIDGGNTYLTGAGGLGGRPNGEPTKVEGTFGLDEVSIERLGNTLTQVMSEASPFSIEGALAVADDGTHVRLDKQTEALANILEAIKENDPCKCEGRAPSGSSGPNSLQTARQYAGELRDHLASIDYRGHADRARGLASDHWERLSTDERVQRAREMAGEQWEKLDAKGRFEFVQSITQEKWEKFNARGRYEDARQRVQDFDVKGRASDLRDAVKDRYDNFDAKAEYERLKDYAGGKYEDLAPEARAKFDQAKDYILDHARMQAARDLWEHLAEEAKERLKKGEDEEGDEEAPAGKGGIKSRIWRGVKRTPGKALRGLGSYLSWSYSKLWKGTKLGGRLAAGAAKLPFGSVNGLGVTDVHVQGEAEPSLTAKNIRRGYYFDVNTKKVITEIKDITGPVKNREGETVLTQEEFDKGLMSGDGESLAGWGLRKSLKVGLGLANLTGRYLSGSYGLLGRGLKGAFQLAYDQFVQFDAYFPGDEEPRIKSSLLKKGFYRDKDGAPLKSLKDIKGPVYDIDDNEVISQEELDRYKSLYTRNGSLLFTVGRGVVSAGAWAGDLAKRAGVGYAKAVGKFYKAMWKGVKGVGRGIKNFFGKRFGGKGGQSPVAQAGGYQTDEELHTAMFEVSIEQLNTQRSILDLLRKQFEQKKRDWRDSDGDGERDNSWKSILARRKAGKGVVAGQGLDGGNNADVVKALDKLGAKLEDSIEDLGDRVEEASEDGMLDQASDLAEISDAWGGGGDEGGRRKGRKGRGKGRGRLGRMKGKLGNAGRRIAGSRAAGWAARGGIMAMEGAATVGSAIMGSSMMAGLGTAAATAGTAAMGWLGAGATAIAGVLSAPMVLAAAAVAGVAYLGYSWYKSSQAKDNPLFYLRMTQYGIDPTDEGRVKQMLALEELLLPAVTFSGPKANVEASRVSIPKLMEILEIEEGEGKRTERALRWLSSRFRPIFLLHVGAMQKLVKSTKLSEEDKLIDGSVIKEFLELVDIKQFTHIYNDMFMSPFDSTFGMGGILDCDADDVEAAFQLVRDRIKPTEKKEEPKAEKPKTEDDEAAKAAAAAAATTALPLPGKDPGGIDPVDFAAVRGSGIEPAQGVAAVTAGAAVAAVAAGASRPMTALPLPPEGPAALKVSGGPAVPQGVKVPAAQALGVARASDPLGAILGAVGSGLKAVYSLTAAKVNTFASKLDIPTAVRYLQYGLTSFDSDKVKQLQQVENLYWDYLRFNGYDNALIEGDLVGLEDTVINIFQPSGGSPQNVVLWIRYRFMPTFLQYAISVRRRFPGDVRTAPDRLTSQLMREVLTEMVQAVDSDSGNLVWLNPQSPWPNYRLNDDSSTTSPYIASLPQSLAEMAVQDLRLGIGPANNSKAQANGATGMSPNLFRQPEEKENGGMWGGIKKFFGFGEDPGGTSGGANSTSGNYGFAGGGSTGTMPSVSGPPVPSAGSAVRHPGGGSGGDINSLPASEGTGWEAMKPIILGAAKMTGFDPFIAANVAAAESRFNPRAGAGGSSAKGLYQFIDSTWQEMLRKYGRKYGIAPNTHQFDPRANALLGMEYMKENYAYMQKKAPGVKITDTALYTTHFLGAYGARKFLTSPASANVQDVVGASAVNANKSVFREPTGQKGVYGRVRTVAESLAEIDKRLHQVQSEHDLKPGQNPTVEPGMENPAVENRSQDAGGDTGGGLADTNADTGTFADPGSAGGGGGGAVPSSGGGVSSPPGGGGGSDPGVTNASNGAPASGSATYAQPPSPDPVAAQASGNAVLTREPDDEQGTYGKLRLPDGTEYFTLELPWRGNATGASCIPPGTYKVGIRNSPKFGRIYEVMNVPGRTAILIHSGNVAGDKSKGFNSHVEGCILLGLNKGNVGGQKAVQQSRAAVAQFMEKMGGNPFTMSVVGAGADPSAKSVGQAPEEPAANFDTGAQDPGAVANGVASGSSAATNTQPSGGYGAQPTPAPSAEGSGSPTSPQGQPTSSQAVTAQSQATTAISTAELSQTVGPLLQKQLEVAQSMDTSLKDIRKLLETMAQQGSSPGNQSSPSGEGQGQLTTAQAAEAGAPPATDPGHRPTQTSTGSGRNPIDTRRRNAVN